MSIVKIDASNTGNFQARKILPKGRYSFEIANDLVVAKAKNSANNKVDVELRCTTEGDCRGAVVYDVIAITQKTEWKLCHLVMAAGTQSEEDVKMNGVDLSLLKGATVEADIDVEGPSKGADGKQYNEKNRVARYVFSPKN